MNSILIDKAGPLPIIIEVKADSDIPVMLEFSGSCFTSQAPSTTGIQLEIDGKPINASIIYANQNQVHLSTVPKAVMVNLGDGGNINQTRKISLTPLPGTQTDANDWFTLKMFNL